MLLKSLISSVINFFHRGKLKLIPPNVFAYLFVGAGNTALNIVLFAILFFSLEGIKYNLEIAIVLAFITTSITGFWLNKNFAFPDSSNLRKAILIQFGKYVLISLFGQVLDYLITKGLIVILTFDAISAYVSATIIIVSSTYFLQRYFTFRKSEDPNNQLKVSNKNIDSHTTQELTFNKSYSK